MSVLLAHTGISRVLPFALAYCRRAWGVIPIDPATKRPFDPAANTWITDWQNRASSDEEEVSQWFRDRDDIGIGMVTGRWSGVIAIDIDSKAGKNGQEGVAYLQERHGKLPSTLMAITPSGGVHCLFRYPRNRDGCRIGNRTNLGAAAFGRDTHVDVRADAGQINVAPTMRDGRAYQWLGDFISAAIADLPDPWLELLIEGETKPRPGAPLPNRVGEGGRNDALTSHLGGFRAKGLDADQLIALGHDFNERCCDPPLSRDEVERTARGLMRYDPTDPVRFTELGNAQRLQRLHGERIRFTIAGGWKVYNGKV